ncbi:MAG: formylglycine-generating enzyme family protein [Chitinivibrionales bacterium]|nr:formylglycine-generating enzyme family protein [Chitinivibrionales bacterium]
MKTSKTLFILLAAASLCLAQTINVGGVVKDAVTSTPLQNVVVRLVNGNLTNNTDALGRFSLQKTSSVLIGPGAKEIRYSSPVLTGNGALQFTLGQTEHVAINTYSLQGALISSLQKDCGAGAMTIFPQKGASGFYLYQIRIGDKTYTLKSINIGNSSAGILNAGATTASSLGKRASSQAAFFDTLVFSLSGYTTKKITIAKADTSQMTVLLSSSVVTTNGDGIDMIQIPAGTFIMGSNGSNDGGDPHAPPYQVTISSPFKMGRTTVTQVLYQNVMGYNPSVNIDGSLGGGFVGDSLPVDMVTWYDAVLFCNKLSKTTGKDTVYKYDALTISTGGHSCSYMMYSGSAGPITDFTKHGYRLPTGAEWEYACRAGTTTTYWYGDSLDGRYGWYWFNCGGTSHPVGTRPANAWGLCDMSGNMFQWTNDWGGAGMLYDTTAKIDPIGKMPFTGVVYVRGGSWWQGHLSTVNASADRFDYQPWVPHSFYGFRVVLR